MASRRPSDFAVDEEVLSKMLGEGLAPGGRTQAAQVSMQQTLGLPSFLGRLHAPRRVEVTSDAKAIL
jgi:hypothetical protein